MTWLRTFWNVMVLFLMYFLCNFVSCIILSIGLLLFALICWYNKRVPLMVTNASAKFCVGVCLLNSDVGVRVLGACVII